MNLTIIKEKMFISFIICTLVAVVPHKLEFVLFLTAPSSIFIYVYICSCLCMYVCMYGSMYVCMYVCMYACICMSASLSIEYVCDRLGGPVRVEVCR